MALTEIEYGSLASSATLNNNFSYLENRIGNMYNSMISNNAGTNSNIASINSAISTLSNKLSNDIETLTTNQDGLIQKFSENGFYISAYYNGNSWYREHFSDKEMTNRVWLEQAGLCSSVSNTKFIKEFSDTTYTILLGTHCTYFEGGGINVKSKTGFSHWNGKGWGYYVSWYACGK